MPVIGYSPSARNERWYSSGTLASARMWGTSPGVSSAVSNGAH